MSNREVVILLGITSKNKNLLLNNVSVILI